MVMVSVPVDQLAELNDLSATLRTLVQQLSDSLEDGARPSPAALARRFYAARRMRAFMVPSLAALLHEPAWDILLDLFIATDAGRPISVSSACIAAAVPATTALRTISALEARGLIHIEPDPTDGRRRFVRLAPTTLEQITAFLLKV